MIISIYTDGGSKGNPGPASIGVIAYLEKREIIRYRKDIGIATNNDAEYRAVVIALGKIKSYIPGINLNGQELRINFYSDSKLLVSQLNGVYKVKNSRIRDYIMQIRILEQGLGFPVSYNHIPREKNINADNLVNDVAF